MHPFLDEKGILRVGGRLHQSKISLNQRHPIILPADAHITKLIISEIHQLTLHGGPQLVLNILNCRYWVLGARRIVRQIVQKCIVCFRQCPSSHQQLMGNLPLARLEPCRPFLRSGVDYAGPVHLRLSKGRGIKTTKGYIAVFICMVTGAMHLELASDLTSSAFVAVFKRFVARRGRCTDIYSDNGTNFKGAQRELLHLYREISKDEKLNKLIVNGGTIWHFNPPSSPHMGGYWEAAVKRVKYHLKRILGNTTLTFEEFTTTLCQIEACINSRPLCPASLDPADLNALTPGHFLIGEPLLSVPEPDLRPVSTNLMTRWQHVQQLYQHFWSRWHKEYLIQLQNRHKWQQPNRNLEIGELVIIRDEQLPPTKWKLGRIVDTHTGTDGLVRVVSIKTKDGISMRPSVKVCPLPRSEDVNTVPK